MSRVTYITAHPRVAATGEVEQVRLAGGGQTAPYHRAGQHYRAGVVKEPRFSAALAFDKMGWSGGAVPTATAINFQPGAVALLDQLGAMVWTDADVAVDAGPEDGILARRLTGKVAAQREDNSVLVITAADLSLALNKPVAAATFVGTGGIEGDEAAAGRVKRRSFGRVFNVEGRVLLAAWNIYEFGDPARPMAACLALRDKGRSGDLAILNWQGSIDDTLAALKLAVAPQGGGVFAPSIACAKWWTSPAGPLTADLMGEIGDGYGETVAAIADAVCKAVEGPLIDNLASATAMRDAVAGWHVDAVTTTAAAVLDDMMRGAGLFWVLNASGNIYIDEWSWDGPAEALSGLYLGRDSQYPPHKSRRLGYKLNQHRHSSGDIAADILAEDVYYSDGSTVEALKPAEAGSTSGAPVGTNVGWMLAEELVVDTSNALTTIALLSVEAEELRAIVSGVEGDVETLYSTTATQGAAISMNATAISNIAGDLSELTVSVSAHGASIVSTQTAVSGLQTTVADMETVLLAQGALVAVHASAITNLEDQVANLDINVSTGVNLLPNGGLENGWGGFTSWGGAVSVVNNNAWGNYFYTTSNTLTVIQSPQIAATAGVEYCFSADLAFSASGTDPDAYCYLDILFFDASNAVILDSPNAQKSANEGFGQTRTFVTATAPAGSVTLMCRMVRGDAGGGAASMRLMKLERGNKPTLFSSEASVTQAFSSVNGAFARAALRLSVDGLMTGWETNNNGTVGDFNIHADFFRVLKPGGGARTEYSDGNWRVYDSAGVLRARFGVW